MRRIKRFIARVYDLPNAYRVLDIMDECGVDIEEKYNNRWAVCPKWYLSEKDAKDLQTICLFKRQYKKRSVLWKAFFKIYRGGYRILNSWF